jgi:DNA-binding MarR family transcriptional regulator
MGSQGQDDLSRIGEAFNQVFRASHAARLHERALARAGADVDRTGFLLLSRLGGEEGVRVSDLAAEMGLDASTISRKVQELEAAVLADWPEAERARLAELLEQLATDIRKLGTTR